MKKVFLPVVPLCLLLAAAAAFAGGPLYTYDGCTPVVFPASAMPIPYTVDQGPLGDFTNDNATALVDDCFGVWQAVPTAAVSFVNNGFLPRDVDASFIDASGIWGIDAFFSRLQSLGTNPVIFDSDGGIIDALYGQGASDSIIGFSGSVYDYDAINGYYYTDGLSLLNGRFTQAPNDWDEDRFKATFVHEFGHFIGLDHSQINLDLAGDGDAANDIYVPTMFPFSTDDDTSLGELNPDDEAAVTMLYPADDAVVDAAYGRIRGRLRWLSGLPALGANVIAVGQGDGLMSRFSCVSDYCMLGDGSFEMLVAPGTYTFLVEPIYPFFTGGSSVGPYADFPFSRSFIFPAVATEYEESLTVAAGETKEIQLTAVRNLLRPFPGIRAVLFEWLYYLGLLGRAG